jgi:hypothetical protein
MLGLLGLLGLIAAFVAAIGAIYLVGGAMVAGCLFPPPGREGDARSGALTQAGLARPFRLRIFRSPPERDAL